MSTRGSSIAFVALMVFSLIPVSHPLPHGFEQSPIVLEDHRFDGFLVGEAENPWNQTPWPTIAVPDGFTYESTTDYSDVGVLINNLSEESRTIGWAFVAARNISLDRVFIFNQSGTPTGETINRNQFNTYFALPFLDMLQNSSSANDLNYLVTTKGVPLRVSGGNDKASFDQELSLLGGIYNSSVGGDYWFDHGYGPLAGKSMEAFTRSKYGFFLVTRLTGYTVETALDLIERANQSFGQRGTFVLDLATNRNNSGYQFWNDDLYVANTSLNASMNHPVQFDEETEFLTNISNVIGYASWGSNDGNWNRNYLSNGGFDTLDASWQSGSRYWTSSGPSVAAGDAFNWSYQTDVKQGGNGAFEATIRTACDQDAGDTMQGIYGEYFDNDGVSFSTSSMPALIDRAPDKVQVEPHLNHGASYSAYTGLDDRFKEHWGARWSGLIDVPDTGNWTFFINSDDGSELWVNGQSLAKNYGSHGMRERSGYLNLSEGLHEFRIEFFQGGGPHGLIFSWEGPNTSKAPIPSSAFYVSGGVTPRAQNLAHHWAFEEGAGSIANDSVNGGANLTLNGMDASSWRTCADGGCLWFDGTNDSAEVDVDDWYGNLTVSQWVWANTTSQPTYASTFATDNNAGSNLSFQHMMSGGKWKLHNNQSNAFGNVIPQRWTHLVTVFDDGDIRQYMDGTLVNSNTYPNGSFNNIELYKLGVNRAGNAYFEGMIDEVMIWDVALTDQDITSLRRTIVDNCTSYSGAGTDVADLQTTFTVPQGLEDHVWVAYVYGQREGEVNGEFLLDIKARDSSGQVVSTNTSSSKTFTTNWASQSMRFRPDAAAATFDVRVSLNIASASTVGSFHIDTVLIRAIRPHMDWVNGSIADTAVSTGGRSFEWGTAYGQSLIADLLEDGVSGVKGYVYEPYLTAVGLPSVYLPTYASGYNLAESHAAGNRQHGWMGVVVGDPKMAAFYDVVHDVNIVDVRIPGPINLGEPTTLQVLVENLGMGEANGTLSVQTVLGNIALNQSSIVLPSGNQTGSRAIINLTIVPPNAGYLDLRIRYDNRSSEQNFANNLKALTVVVNEPPEIMDAYCSAALLSRGAYTICTIEATDDVNVTRANLEWRIVPDQGPSNQTWTSIALGKIGPTKWETSLVVPVNASLGNITLVATVEDIDGMTASKTYWNVTRVVDAPPSWFGPHVEGVDPSDWNQASLLPNQPLNGLYRHIPSTLKACVLDADYRLDEPAPVFLTSRGTVGNITFVPQPAADLYCFIAPFSLEAGTSLEDVDLQVRRSDGSLLLQRTVGVEDMAPQLNIQVEGPNGELLDRVMGSGEERIRVQVNDLDDPSTPFIGNLMIQWPGSDAIQLPLDIPANSGLTYINLTQLEIPLEGGELFIEASGIGQHGGSATAQHRLPFLLTPPEIVFVEACDANGVVETMTFGQVAVLIVGVVSDRPLDRATAQLTQMNWAINAPETTDVPWSQDAVPSACDTTMLDHPEAMYLLYRLKLDSSLVDGDGKALFTVSDLDGLVKSTNVPLVFQHAPTLFETVNTSSAIPGKDVFTNVTVSDLDGLERVICSYTLYDEDGALLTQSAVAAGPEGAFSNTLRWQFPITSALANTTLSADITCMDNLQQSFSRQEALVVGPNEVCLNCSTNLSPEQKPASDGEAVSSELVLGGMVFLIFIGVLGYVLSRRGESAEETAWGDSDEDTMVSLEALFESDEPETAFENADTEETATHPEFIPEGWTMDDYERWLEGPTPDGWTEEQWKTYTETHQPMFEELRTLSEG